MLGVKTLNSTPYVSVVMAIYKEPVEWIHLAIDSILNQTFSDFEFIIINDKPDREENALLLNEYQEKDRRVVVVTNETNIGLTKSLNKGLQISKGKYIARMDADDIAMPTRFASQVHILDSNMCDISHSAYVLINDKGQAKNECVKRDIDYSDLFLQNQIAHPTVMFNRNILSLRKSFYNEEIKRSQDYEVWTFLYLKDVRFAYNKTPLIYYRVSEQQISTKSQADQWRYSRKARSRLVCNFLKSKNIKVDLHNLNSTINKLITLYHSASPKEQSNICRVLYLLFYTKVANNPLSIFQIIKFKPFFIKINFEYTKLLYKAVLGKTKPYLILQDENDN